MVEFEDDTFVTAYTNDLAIANSARNKDMIMSSSQPVDKVVAWITKVNLTLNTSKYKITFFNLDSTEATRLINITIDGKLMFRNSFRIFLGVRYDRQLTLGEYAQKLCQSMSGCINLTQLWEARPGDHTHRTVVTTTLR